MTGKPREKLHEVYLRCWRCGRHHYNTRTEQLKPINTPTNSWYTQPLEQSQASENGMEALELDMPSETVSILESLPSLEGMSINSQSWQ